MRVLATLAAVAVMFGLCACTSETTEASAGAYPTVQCPVYEGYPDCSAQTQSVAQAQTSAR
jgi:hypothetical protein